MGPDLAAHELGHSLATLSDEYAGTSGCGNAAGEIIGVIGTISEISARKAAEEELRRSEERFRSAFEDAPLGVCMITLESNWLLPV